MITDTPARTAPATPRLRRTLVLVTAALTAVAAFALPSRTHAAASGDHDEHAGIVGVLRTPRQVAFHDGMRKLWEDHVTWTRLAIVSFAADLPDLPVTEQRLLVNQQDLGDAIKPFYGVAAGDRLATLLREHITTAVDLLVAAKAGDSAAVRAASARWYANAQEIADFLAAANPHLSRVQMRAAMRLHLDQTLAEAVHRLQGDFAADVQDYEAVHQHILVMADTISAAIMRQFPKRFR